MSENDESGDGNEDRPRTEDEEFFETKIEQRGDLNKDDLDGTYHR